MEQHDIWQELRRHVSDMADTIDGAFRRVRPFSRFGRVGRPPVNVYETAEDYVVEAEVPGVHKEALHVSLTDGNLLIEGREDRGRYAQCTRLCEERGEAEFRREIPLPEGTDQEATPTATVENGLLTVRLKKAPPRPGKTVPVEVV
jgi:HSP20 family protein